MQGEMLDHTVGAEDYVRTEDEYIVLQASKQVSNRYLTAEAAEEFARSLWCALGGTEDVVVAKLVKSYRAR